MKVCLHPGFVKSKYDRDTHFVGVGDLVKLYGVKKTDKVVISDPHINPFACEMRKDYLHLYPDYDGNYYDIHLTTQERSV